MGGFITQTHIETYSILKLSAILLIESLIILSIQFQFVPTFEKTVQKKLNDPWVLVLEIFNNTKMNIVHVFSA